MISKRFSLLFFLKKSRGNSETAIIYLGITVDQQRSELSTKRVCDPKRWNSQTGRMSGTKEDARTVNAYLLQPDIFFKKSLTLQWWNWMPKSMMLPPLPSPKSYHRLRFRFTLNEGCVSSRKGNRTVTSLAEGKFYKLVQLHFSDSKISNIRPGPFRWKYLIKLVVLNTVELYLELLFLLTCFSAVFAGS